MLRHLRSARSVCHLPQHRASSCVSSSSSSSLRLRLQSSRYLSTSSSSSSSIPPSVASTSSHPTPSVITHVASDVGASTSTTTTTTSLEVKSEHQPTSSPPTEIAASITPSPPQAATPDTIPPSPPTPTPVVTAAPVSASPSAPAAFNAAAAAAAATGLPPPPVTTAAVPDASAAHVPCPEDAIPSATSASMTASNTASPSVKLPPAGLMLPFPQDHLLWMANGTQSTVGDLFLSKQPVVVPVVAIPVVPAAAVPSTSAAPVAAAVPPTPTPDVTMSDGVTVCPTTSAPEPMPTAAPTAAPVPPPQPRTVLVVGFVGAYLSVCQTQLPAFSQRFGDFKKRGVDAMYGVSVNDHAVLKSFAGDVGLDLEKLPLIADQDATFVRSLNLALDLSAAGMGIRAKRFVLLVREGMVEEAWVEDNPGDLTVSSADAVLKRLPVIERKHVPTTTKEKVVAAVQAVSDKLSGAAAEKAEASKQTAAAATPAAATDPLTTTPAISTPITSFVQAATAGELAAANEKAAAGSSTAAPVVTLTPLDANTAIPVVLDDIETSTTLSSVPQPSASSTTSQPLSSSSTNTSSECWKDVSTATTRRYDFVSPALWTSERIQAEHTQIIATLQAIETNATSVTPVVTAPTGDWTDLARMLPSSLRQAVILELGVGGNQLRGISLNEQGGVIVHVRNLISKNTKTHLAGGSSKVSWRVLPQPQKDHEREAITQQHEGFTHQIVA